MECCQSEVQSESVKAAKAWLSFGVPLPSCLNLAQKLVLSLHNQAVQGFEWVHRMSSQFFYSYDWRIRSVIPIVRSILIHLYGPQKTEFNRSSRSVLAIRPSSVIDHLRGRCHTISGCDMFEKNIFLIINRNKISLNIKNSGKFCLIIFDSSQTNSDRYIELYAVKFDDQIT